MTIQSGSNDQGLFRSIGSGGVVKDLNIDSASITGYGNMYGGTISNCTVTNTYIHDTYSKANGWSGGAGTVTGCTVEDFTLVAEGERESAGGIIGHAYNGLVPTDCKVLNANITATGYPGNLVGYVAGGDTSLGGDYYNDPTSTLASYGGSAGTVTDNAVRLYKINVVPDSVNVVAGEDIVTFNSKNYAASGAAIAFDKDADSTVEDLFEGTTKFNVSGSTYTYTMPAVDLNVTQYPVIDGLTFNTTGNYFEIATAADLQTLSAYINQGFDCPILTSKSQRISI